MVLTTIVSPGIRYLLPSLGKWRFFTDSIRLSVLKIRPSVNIRVLWPWMVVELGRNWPKPIWACPASIVPNKVTDNGTPNNRTSTPKRLLARQWWTEFCSPVKRKVLRISLRFLSSDSKKEEKVPVNPPVWIINDVTLIFDGEHCVPRCAFNHWLITRCTFE